MSGEEQDEPTVFIIVGRVWEETSGTPDDAIPVNIFLTAPDDDSAVRRALEALAKEGYAETELDQIGALTEEPEDPTFESAYQDALEGNVAVVAFRE
ncbi:regulator [Breoghania sp. L-A4]|uniref:regulator n=1 Tax=Breoghania sp. L-A4 TaxID=2304600 RepID=UPI003204DE94